MCRYYVLMNKRLYHDQDGKLLAEALSHMEDASAVEKGLDAKP